MLTDLKADAAAIDVYLDAESADYDVEEKADAAALATYNTAIAAAESAAAQSLEQNDPSPWAAQGAAIAAALATQAAAQSSAEQTAEDAYADDQKASEIAANDAQLAQFDAQAQAWHDQVIALAQASNNLTLSASNTAAQLAAADAYFASVGNGLRAVPSATGVPSAIDVPDPLTPPGGDTPITLTGDYGYAHPIGAYNVGDTVDLIDGVVQQMFKVSPDGEPSIGPQDIMSYSWLGAGGNMPYGPIANRIPTALNSIAPGGPQPEWSANSNPFGPAVLQDPGKGEEGGAGAPPGSSSNNLPQAGGASNQPRTGQLSGTNEEGNNARPVFGPPTPPKLGPSLNDQALQAQQEQEDEENVAPQAGEGQAIIVLLLGPGAGNTAPSWKYAVTDRDIRPGPEPLKAFLVGGLTGAQKVGQVLTAPLRLLPLPIDWQKRDDAIDQQMSYLGLKGTATETATDVAANVGGKAVQAVVVILSGGAAIGVLVPAGSEGFAATLGVLEAAGGTMMADIAYNEGVATYYDLSSGDTKSAIEHGSNALISSLFTASGIGRAGNDVLVIFAGNPAGPAAAGATASGHAYNVSTANMTAAERASALEYARRVNAWLAENGPVVVQSTKGALRSQANAAARAERLRAARAGTPYQGQAGHVPDTALSNQANPPAGWLDMAGTSNNAVGGGLSSRIGTRVIIIFIDGQAP